MAEHPENGVRMIVFLTEADICHFRKYLKNLTNNKDFIAKVDFSLRKQLSGLHFQEVRPF